MVITNVEVRKVEAGKIKGVATVVIDNEFVIHNIRIIKSNSTGNLIVSMPNRKLKDGSFKDVCHPIKKETRENFNTVILNEFNKLN